MLQEIACPLALFRFYLFSGLFKGLKECNTDATNALIQWNDNWIAFLDNMLQMLILQEDTRSLFVPTGIQRLSIDTKQHLKYMQAFEENHLLPVNASKEMGCIRY